MRIIWESESPITDSVSGDWAPLILYTFCGKTQQNYLNE